MNPSGTGILRELRDYLRTHQRVSLENLAVHFNTQPEAIRGMLDLWVARGKVRHCPVTACASCPTACSSKPGEIYEWCG